MKTPKGIEEVERKSHGLAMKARQVLIMIDGKRDQRTLEGIFPPEWVGSVLESLLRDGFIRPLEPVLAPPPQAPAPAPKAALPADADGRYEMARNFMLNTTSAFLGMVGSSLTGKIEQAGDLASLAALFGEWHDAMALSPDGKKRLAELDSKLLDLLGDVPAATRPAAPASPQAVAPAVRPENDDQRLEMARNFMVNTTNTFIGVAGSSLISRLEGAGSIAALRQLYYDWREALQLSKEAKARLPDLEKRLAALLS